jgi:hypothetical protein
LRRSGNYQVSWQELKRSLFTHIRSGVAELRLQIKSFEEKLDNIAKGLSHFTDDVYKNIEYGKEWKKKHQQWIESVDMSLSVLVESKTLIVDQLAEAPDEVEI